MGCYCDYGYHGPACNKMWNFFEVTHNNKKFYLTNNYSTRRCKYGYDPSYTDDTAFTYRYSNWSYVIYYTDEFAEVEGNYTLTFFDVNGAPWVTDSIDYNADCAQVMNELLCTYILSDKYNIFDKMISF